MPDKKITWTDVLLRQRELTIPQDSNALGHLLNALDSMCHDRDHEITSERILSAVQRALDFAAAREPKPAGWYADTALSPRQRREITEAAARVDGTEA